MDIDFDDLVSLSANDESYTHPETSRIISELDRKTAARTLAIPTNIEQVKLRLRDLGEPITLFGEKAEDRRDRLREMVSRLRQREKEEKGEGGGEEEEEESSDSGIEEGEKEEEFYTEGTLELVEARKEMMEYSIGRAKRRLSKQRSESTLPLGRLIDVRRAIFTDLKSFTNLGSQIGDTRPLSSVRFSPDSKLLLTGSWGGTVKVSHVPECREVKVCKGHKDRIGGVAWHPQATLSQSRSALNFATSGAEGEVKLWSLEQDAPLLTLTGHSARVCRIAFHPSGKYLGSASYDGTWRLWDTERGGEELLLQEGHSKEVYAIAFQEDGALVCTGGLDAIGRVWDLRSGKTAMVLDGHVKDILGIDFSPNGHQIATGSNDDTIRCWDMRTLKTIYTIPAHKSAVSDVKFFHSSQKTAFAPTAFERIPSGFNTLDVFGDLVKPDSESQGDGEGDEAMRDLTEAEEKVRKDQIDLEISGLFLISSGYDGRVKIWSADDWQLVKSLVSDESSKVMSCDVSSDGKLLASAEYSRTYKLFSNPNREW